MFFSLSKTLDLAFSPFSWALALLVVFSLEIVANGLLRRLEASSTRTFREDVTYDAALLLGGIVDVRATDGVASWW